MMVVMILLLKIVGCLVVWVWFMLMILLLNI